MYILGTHRSVAQRSRLYADRGLGSGNFFWHAWRVARDRDRPLLFHPDAGRPGWERREWPAMSLDDMRIAVVRYAHWYREQGVRAGSHVGLHTGDGLLGLLHHIAVTGLGAAAVHCNPGMASATAAEYFTRTATTLVVGDAALLKDLRAAWETTGGPAPATHDIRVVDDEAVRPPAPLPDFPHRHADDDLVMISHSSGTTGRPKAPVFHHRSFFVGKRERLWNFPSRRSDRLLTALPHSHSAGISYLSIALLLGIPTLLLDGADGDRVVRAINAFRPTLVLGFPLTLAEIDPTAIEPAAARRIHTWNGMGDASHERHIAPLTAVGAPGRGSVYLDGLGSSEMGMVLFKAAHSADSGHGSRFIGTPVGVVRQAAVLDPSGRELPYGQAGLLGVRGPSVTPGYWDDPGLTKSSILSGYFLTGDVVRRDGEGRWYHLDRTPDVIHTATGDVYSLPLEEVVLSTTQALDAAVVAVDDPAQPDRSLPAAVVLHRDEVRRSPADLLAVCNTALDRAGLPRLSALVLADGRDGLPVGVTGKVLKRVLRERHRDLLGRPADAATATTAARASATGTGNTTTPAGSTGTPAGSTGTPAGSTGTPAGSTGTATGGTGTATGGTGRTTAPGTPAAPAASGTPGPTAAPRAARPEQARE
ncbi:class I adenylate-forming enzyme family protein [Streptomyces pyxinae]|uniref:class I adenylate-forming enzyme family protein n=1 Tax=Streptomyces pyxinae TaxID=2970734 RepID=UPI002867B2A0|nr:class I adenylate-forming enzyme family protein [Streptomyces sp. LP05-1]